MRKRKDAHLLEQSRFCESTSTKEISSILNNWDDATSAYADAMDSAGVSTEAQSTYMESLNAKIEQFNTSVQELYYDFLDSDLVGGVVDFGTSFIQTIDKIIDSIGSLGTAILAIGAGSVLGSLFKGLRQMGEANGFVNALSQGNGLIAGLASAAQTASNAFAQTGSATTALSTGLSTLKGSINGVTLALLGIGAGIAIFSAINTAIQNYEEEQRKAAKETATSWGDSDDELMGYKDRIIELRTALDSGTLSEQEAYDAKSELLSIQDALSESYGVQAEGIDLVNGDYERQLELLDQISTANAQIAIKEQGDQFEEARKKIEDYNVAIGSAHDLTAQQQEDLYNLTAPYGDYFQREENQYGEITLKYTGNAEDAEEVLRQLEYDLNEFQKTEGNEDAFSWIYDGIEAALSDSSNLLEDWGDIYDNYLDMKVKADETLYKSSEMGANENGRTASEWLEDYAQAMSDYNEALSSGTQNEIIEARENLSDMARQIDELLNTTGFSQFARNVQEIADQFNTAADNAQKFKEAASGVTVSNNGVDKQINDIVQRISDEGLTELELRTKIVESDDGIHWNKYLELLDLASEKYGLSTDQVIEALIEIGAVAADSTEEVDDLGDALVRALSSEEDNNLSEQIDNFQSDIDDIQNALDSLRNGEEVNLTDLVQDFPELATSMGNLEKGLENLQLDRIQEFSDAMRDYLDTTEDWTQANYHAFDELFANTMSNIDFSAYTDQYEKALKSFTSVEKSLQQSYGDLGSSYVSGIMDQLESAIGQNEYAMEAVVMLSMNPDAANWTYQEFCQQLENAVLYIQLRVTEDSLTELQDTLDGLQEEQDLIESSQSLSEAMNIKKTTKDYKQLIDNSKKQVSNLKDQNNLLEVQKGLYEDLDRDTKDIQSQINDNTKAMRSALEDQISWNNEALALNYNQAAEGIDAIRTALSEAASDSLLSTDSITNLVNTLSDLEDFDATDVFYQTANGVDLNTTALKHLEDEYVSLKKQDYQSQLAELGQEYLEAKAYADDYAEGLEGVTDEMIDAALAAAGYRGLQDIESDIMYVDLLSNELDGLTSAYQTWINAQAQGSYAEAYENMGDYYSTAEDLINRGWVGNEGLNAYLDLMLSADQRTGDTVADFQKLTQAIEGTDHSLMDYFQYDDNGKLVNGGLYDFIDDVIDTMGDAYARFDEETGQYELGIWTDEDVQAVADRFGTTAETVYWMIDAMKEAGFEVTTTENYLQDAIDAAQKGTESLRELQSEGGVISEELDLDYEVSELSTDEVEEKIAELEAEKARIEVAYDANDEEAQEAIAEIDATLGALENQRVQLNIEAEIEEGNLQELDALINEEGLEAFAIRVGIDVDNEEELVATAEVVQQLAQNERVEVAVETAVEETGMSLEELAQYDETEITEHVNVDAADAEATVEYIQNAFEEEKTWDLTVRIDEDQFNQLTQEQEGTVDVNADTSEAMGTVEEFIQTVEGMEATIQINTSSNGAESAETSSSGADIDAKVNYTVGEFPTEIEEPATGTVNYEIGEYPAELPEPVTGLANLTIGEYPTEIPEHTTGIVDYSGNFDEIGEAPPCDGIVTYTVDDSEVRSYSAPSKEGVLVYTVQVEGDTGDMGGQATGSTITFSVDSSQVDSYVPEGKEAVVTFSAETSAPDGYQPADKNATVIYSINVSQPNGYQPGNKTATVNYIPNTSALPTSFPTITRTVNYVATGATSTSPALGTAHTEGTARANGTAYSMWSNYRHSVGAYANGSRQDWSLPKDETALVNEVGTEGLVRNGVFSLIPGGAHFESFKKGDIIFNNEQVKELLANGRVISNGGHGRIALADGTAYNVMNAYGGSSTINATGSNSTRVTGSTNAAGQTINNYNDNSTTNNTTNNNVTVSSGSGSSSSSDSSDFKETIDWIEVAIDRVERKIEKLDTKANRTYKSWSSRNSNLTKEIDKIGTEIDKQTRGYDKYMEKAESIWKDAGLSDSTIKKIKNGSISIKDYTNEETYDAIEEALTYYEKALDCEQAILDLTDQQMDLYVQAFDNVVQKYDDLMSTMQYNLSMFDQFISQSESQGYVVSTKYYQAQIDENNKLITQAQKEQTELIQKINEAVDAGMDKGSEQWYELCQQYDDLTVQIEEWGTENLDLANSIRQVYWDLFDMLEDRMSNITSEADFLIDLMSNTDLYTDNGQLTDTGMATMGLRAENYNVYMAQADKYAEEIASIQKEIESDPFNQDLIDRQNELISAQQSAILSAEDEKQAIKSLVEDGINLELESLDSLIKEYEDALDSQKDLYTYQKKVQKQTKEIADLEKQLSAYTGDTSEETRSTVQQLQVSLQEAQESLEETEADHVISEQKKLLENLYDEYSEVLNKRLDDLDLLISDMIDMVNENSDGICDTLNEVSENVGYSLSEEMQQIWTNADTVVSTYTGSFDEKTSSIKDVLDNIKGDLDSMMKTLDSQASSNTKSVTSSSGSKTSATNTATGSTKSSSSSSSSTTKKSSSSSSSKSTSTQGDGKIQVGDKVTFDSGRYYYDSYGSSPSGYQHRGSSVYVTRVISSPKSGQNYPYHISTGKSLGSGDLGWLKKSQISGYATGVQKVTDDELAWTQEDHSKEFIVRKSDGAVLTPLHSGDMVLPNYASENIWKMSTSPEDFIKENLALGDVHATIEKEGNTIGDVSFEVNLPNVQNYEEFKYALQHDRNFEKMIQSMTTELATGGSSLKKYKY